MVSAGGALRAIKAEHDKISILEIKFEEESDAAKRLSLATSIMRGWNRVMNICVGVKDWSKRPALKNEHDSAVANMKRWETEVLKLREYMRR